MRQCLACEDLLDHARAMFRAEIAEVTLYARGEGGESLRTTSIQDEIPTAMVPVKLAADDPIHARVATERKGFFSATAAAATDAVRRMPLRVPMPCPLLDR